MTKSLILLHLSMKQSMRILSLTTLFIFSVTLLRGQENSAVVPQSREDNPTWVARHQLLVERAKTNPEVVFFGDSITELWEDFGSEGKPIWKERYAPLHAANFGISADKTQNILWRLQNGEMPEGSHPKVAVILAGTNNIYTNNAQQIGEGVGAIAHEILKRSPDTKILILGVFPRAEQPTNSDRKLVADMNGYISKLDDHKSIFYLDFGSKFLQPDGTISKDTMTDFIHPTGKGFQIWADGMQDQLMELYNSSK